MYPMEYKIGKSYNAKNILRNIVEIIMKQDSYSYSKNFQSDSTIKKFTKKNFNKSAENIVITSLTGGTKSAVYLYRIMIKNCFKNFCETTRQTVEF